MKEVWKRRKEGVDASCPKQERATLQRDVADDEHSVTYITLRRGGSRTGGSVGSWMAKPGDRKRTFSAYIRLKIRKHNKAMMWAHKWGTKPSAGASVNTSSL